MNHQRLARASIVVVAVLLLAVLHFAVGTRTHQLHVVHVLLGSLTLIPILAAAVWFGLRGGLAAAVLAGAIYYVHMRLSWPGQPMENVNQAATIGTYLVVGIVSGILVDAQERERRRRMDGERNAQRSAIIQGFASLARALGSRDGASMLHSENVARLSVELGRRLGLPPDRVEILRLASLMHDIGKIGVRDDVLLKPGALTPDELTEIHHHPAIAAAILKPIQGTEEIAQIVLAHHERLDGSGYPHGLRDEQIPLESKVLSVADAFCALTEQRPYHGALMDPAHAMSIIDPMAGQELDDQTVQILRELISTDQAGNAPQIATRRGETNNTGRPVGQKIRRD